MVIHVSITFEITYSITVSGCIVKYSKGVSYLIINHNDVINGGQLAEHKSDMYKL